MVFVGLSHHRPMINLPTDLHKRTFRHFTIGYRFPAGSSKIACFYNFQLFKPSNLKYY